MKGAESLLMRFFCTGLRQEAHWASTPKPRAATPQRGGRPAPARASSWLACHCTRATSRRGSPAGHSGSCHAGMVSEVRSGSNQDHIVNVCTHLNLSPCTPKSSDEEGMQQVNRQATPGWQAPSDLDSITDCTLDQDAPLPDATFRA
eukprot:6310930-Amphidinium_carterae.1